MIGLFWRFFSALDPEAGDADSESCTNKARFERCRAPSANHWFQMVAGGSPDSAPVNMQDGSILARM
ncbi:MAG TPA: hypothetical protein VFE06_08485 [Acidobacteriaceae bacterium]|nr:hypothetical protein [Acidobacteriaceae bacterium]